MCALCLQFFVACFGYPGLTCNMQVPCSWPTVLFLTPPSPADPSALYALAQKAFSSLQIWWGESHFSSLRTGHCFMSSAYHTCTSIINYTRKQSPRLYSQPLYFWPSLGSGTYEVLLNVTVNLATDPRIFSRVIRHILTQAVTAFLFIIFI